MDELAEPSGAHQNSSALHGVPAQDGDCSGIETFGESELTTKIDRGDGRSRHGRRAGEQVWRWGRRDGVVVRGDLVSSVELDPPFPPSLPPNTDNSAIFTRPMARACAGCAPLVFRCFKGFER